jgi:hypothetical protein
MEHPFHTVTAADIDTLKKYFPLRAHKSCDSVFLDMFLWKDYYRVRIRETEGRALEWIQEVDGILYAGIPVCAPEDLPRYFLNMQEYFNREEKKKMVVYSADEEAVELLNLPESGYLVEEKPEYADYLYDADALRSLSGKKYHKKKNHVNAFRKEYDGRFCYRPLNCGQTDAVAEFLSRWKDLRGAETDDQLEAELRGISDILEHCSQVQARMAGIYVDETLEAFTLGSYNEEKRMAIIHIEKANPKIRGLYPFINQQFLIHEFPDALLVNREDDAGVEGLRKAKLSWHPVDMARKYRIEQR